MEFKDQIIFSPAGGMDTDSDARAVQKGDYRFFEYCRLGQTTGQGFTVVTSSGTLEITNEDIQPGDKVVGTGLWQNKFAIVYLLYKDLSDDEIWYYDIRNQTNNLICASAEFNFDPNWFFYHVDIVDDIMKFTDGRWDDNQYVQGARVFNPPYQINLQKALDGEYTSIDLQVIDAIKWPPSPPVCVYDTDQTHADNKLRRKLFRFRIQYIYENSEETAWSLWSNLALPTLSEFVSGNNWPDSSQDNVIKVSFPTGPEVVKKINVAVQIRDDNSGGAETDFGIFLQIDKAAQFISDNVIYTYDFYGNVSTKPISNAQKNYDRLPIVAKCQSAIDNTRIAYTNFREGYDKIDLQIQSEYILNEIEWTPVTLNTSLWATTEAYGPPPEDYRNYIELKPSDGNTLATNFQAGDSYSYTVTLQTGQTVLLTFYITEELASTATTVQDIIEAMAESFVDQINAVAGTTLVAAYPPLTAPINNPYWTIWDGVTSSDANYEWVNSMTGPAVMTKNVFTRATPSWKVGATHQFGIVYGDRAQRDSTVLTSDDMNLFVPWYSDLDTSAFNNFNDPFTVAAKLTINNLPPIWAEKFWIVARRATEIADFSQWVINADGGNSAIVAENDRYVISLDKFYLSNYTGASINQTPQKGDVARFIRTKLANTSDPSASPYIDSYFELEVQEYRPTGGSGNRAAIVVEKFDLALIHPNTYFGEMIEIYTPRKSLDTDGNLFVAEWRDVTEAFPILNPHTINRSHGGTAIYEGSVFDFGEIGQTSIATQTDLSALVGSPLVYSITLININGNYETFQITNVSFDGTSYKVDLTSDITYDFSSAEQGTFTIYASQYVDNGASENPALLTLTNGDVYVRQRQYATGETALDVTAYYFVEDHHYSDYWLSDIHQMGRIAVESPYAKMINRIASSIHSDQYFPGTQINGLSSFSFDQIIVQDMNPVYGEVIRTYNSGRENKTLKCIQERKENSIYINHYPSEALPEGSLIINKTSVFSAWYPYKGMYGAQTAGATALLPDGSVAYFDSINGVFVLSGTNGQTVISEIDPASGKDFKFRKKTKELTALYNPVNGDYIRTYVNQLHNEVGWAFATSDFPAQAGDVVFMNDGETEILASGSYEDMLNLVGNEITFTLFTDSPDEPVVYFTTVLVGVETTMPYLGLIFYLQDAAPIQPVSGTYTISGQMTYQHVVFDLNAGRWRSYYDYNFTWFENFGQTLLGFGTNNQPYLHNQPSLTFHGDSFIQKLSVVSNENPLAIKRFQNMIQRANKTFSVLAFAEPNQSYSEMATEIPDYLFNVYEGYSETAYNKNKYSPGSPSEEYAMMNGEDVRAHSLTNELSYDPSVTSEGSILFSVEISGVLS